jgi:hypothetical protein
MLSIYRYRTAVAPYCALIDLAYELEKPLRFRHLRLCT